MALLEQDDGVDLTVLAGAVVRRIGPSFCIRQDCFQTAYLAGLQALRSAQSHNRKAAAGVLLRAMQTTVYRELHKPRPSVEADYLRAA